MSIEPINKRFPDATNEILEPLKLLSNDKDLKTSDGGEDSGEYYGKPNVSKLVTSFLDCKLTVIILITFMIHVAVTIGTSMILSFYIETNQF